MIKSRAGVIVCFGLFSIAAQTLLFRAYMTAFEGHDIGIGCFFGAWFIWITLGALLVSRIRGGLSPLAARIEWLLMAYIPAFCLQYAGIVYFRDLAGVESYAFLSLQHILWGTLLVTAPVSLITGILFPVLCCWMERQDSQPVGRVYVLEAAGSLLGGLSVTVLYTYGITTVSIFLGLATLVCAVGAWSSCMPCADRPCWSKRVLILFCLLLCAFAWTLRLDNTVTKAVQTHRWRQLLPTGTLQGAFVTPQAEYLYGTYQDQWVVMREGSVCETLGDQTEAGRLAAMTLCQNVAAERILVLGDGLELCRSFLKFAHVTAVDWFHPDPAYVPTMITHVPETYLPDDERLHYRSGDVRKWLVRHPETYDIVLINLPETTNAVFMRFMTTECLAQVKQSLAYGGLVALGIPGGENVLGEELVYVGASMRRTLATQFSQTVLVPGEQSFFLSSSLPYLDDDPKVLQRRFQVLENASAIFPPEALSTLYRPQRSAEVMKAYDQVDWPVDQLVNTASRPNHYLYQLLFLAKQSGLSLLDPVHVILRSGPGLLLIPLVLLGLLRVVYTIKTGSRRRRAGDARPWAGSQFDVLLMVACAGLVGIGTVIILMYAFQMVYGSLYLYVGLISALFMLGLTLGAWGIKRAVAWIDAHRVSGPGRCLGLSLLLVILHGICLAGMGAWIHVHLPQWSFALFLLVAGVFCGGYVPLGARILRYAQMETGVAAGHMQGADHLGAALGGCLASLLLIPLFGAQWALYVMAGLVCANTILVAVLWYRHRFPGPRLYAHPVLTPTGYALSAVALTVIVGSYIVTQAQTPAVPTENAHYKRAWVQGRRMTEKHVVLAHGTAEAVYAEIHEGAELIGYVFDSAAWSEPVYGYNGPLALTVFTEPNGVLIDFKITRSQETPGYLTWLAGWMQSLHGGHLFDAEPLKGVDGVSGATFSSQAILTLLRNSGQRFARAVLADETVAGAEPGARVKTRDWHLIGWAGALVLALGAIYHGRLWSRVLVLVYVVAVSGFWLNRQYALDQVLRLLQGEGMLSVPLASLCLLVGVPLLVLLCGNIYCGYLCPFGALQELLGLIMPKRLKPKLGTATVTWARFIKYGLLFCLVLAFFLGRRLQVPGLDPLVSFFNLRFWARGIIRSTGIIAAIVVLVGGLFVTRLWCRYLCPTGAFLSLFNAAGAWLKRLFPRKKWGRCEFGLSAYDHLDCIYCDRCRYQHVLIPPRDEVVTRAAPRRGSWLFLLLVALALVIGAPAWYPEAGRAAAVAVGEPAVSGLRGQPRDVDVDRIEQLIQQGKLSDREALFYKTGPEDGNRP